VPYKQIGVPDGHRDVSQHGRDPVKQEKLQKINTFHIQQLAYVLEKMSSIREDDGTLLDSTMVVYAAGISDGDRHSHDDLPILLADKGAGTIKSGRHVVYPNQTPMKDLFLSLLDRIGVHGETLGDSTTKLLQFM
jgi:hypothetical protein